MLIRLQTDDEEMSQAKRPKMKPEAMDYGLGLGLGGQSAAVFKTEDLTGGPGPIDLDNADLYEADYDYDYA